MAVTSNPRILAVHLNSSLFFISPTCVFLIEALCSKWCCGDSGTFHPLSLSLVPLSLVPLSLQRRHTWKCAHQFYPLCASSSIGQNSVLWPHLPGGAVGDCSLAECPGGKGSWRKRKWELLITLVSATALFFFFTENLLHVRHRDK